jgi:hypothetical protein
MIIVLDGAEAVGYLRYLAAREIGRPRFEAGGAHLDNEVRERPQQPHGRCRYHDDGGSLTLDGDGPSPREDRPPCTYGGECPYLDNPDIGCPVKEALSSMRRTTPSPARADEVPRSDYVLAPQPAPADPQPLGNNEVGPEPEPQDPDPDAIRVIQIPPQAKRKDAWSEDELWVVARATTLPDAIGAYRAAYPDSARTDGAIKAQWRKLRGPDRELPPATPAPLPDFTGDLTPVTQCEEPPEEAPQGDAPALEDDLGDGTLCDCPLPSDYEVDPKPLTGKPHAWIGMRVRILDPESGLQGRTGLVRDYNYSCRKLRIDLDGSGTLWIAPESLLLIGAGRVS